MAKVTRPPVLYDIIQQTVIQPLFEPEKRHLSKMAHALVEKHNRSTGKPVDVLLYRGENLSSIAEGVLGTRQTTSPCTEVRDEADQWVNQKLQLDKDMRWVSQIVTLLCRKAESMQDIRDALPDSVVGYLDDLKKLPRQREEAYSIRDNARMLVDYNRLKELMEFYAASRLIY